LITFITNSKDKLGSKNLKDRLQEVIEISTELKILVGFLHFSGINELYEILRKLYEENKLSQGQIKILVGLFYNIGKSNNKDTDIEKDLIRELICSIRESLIYSAETVFDRSQYILDENDIFDMIAIKEKQIKIFIELLKKKIVIIKKTRQKNHSKLYLFKTNETSVPHFFITGSSNLTNLGLTGRSEYGYGSILQDEFNIEIRGHGFEEVEKYFDDLWEDAILLSENGVNEIKEIFLPPEETLTEGCCMIKVYEDSCLEMLNNKEKGSLKGKNYYVDKIRNYDKIKKYFCKDYEKWNRPLKGE